MDIFFIMREVGALEMLDYDRKLRGLEKEYFFEKGNSFFETGRFVERYIHELYDFYQNMGYRIRCVVGMNEATTMFYKMVPEFPIQLTPYEKEHLVDWEQFTASDAILVIGSYNSSRRVERRFWNMDLKCLILNLYDYFHFRRCELFTDFWEYRFYSGFTLQEWNKKKNALLKHWYFNSCFGHKVLNFLQISDQLANNNTIWSKTFCVRKAYESMQGSSEMHVWYLQIFIHECIKGRDYLTAKKYILEYDQNGYADATKYRKFLLEWEAILEEIKGRIKNRKQEDFVINWLDAVSDERIRDMPNLCQLAKENVKLSKAYTNTPWTTWCMKSIFAGKGAIEGRLYQHKKITAKSFAFMKRIKEHGFCFYYIGTRVIQKKTFSNHDCGSKEMRENEIPFTFYYWKMLCLLATRNEKLFLIIHEVFATHPPYFSPELNYFEENAELADAAQRAKSCEYTDRQLKWWRSFLNDNICCIYMGDHGDPVDPSKRHNFDYLDRRTNVLFIIENRKRNLKETDRFFTLNNMEKLVAFLLKWDDSEEENIFSDEIYIEEYDRYNREIVDGLLKDGNRKFPDYRNWMQFRALRTDYDMLVRYSNGEDWYFVLPDEDTNYMNEPDYGERIQELKEHLGENFINIWEEDFFIHSRRLHQRMREGERGYRDHLS